MPLFYQSILLVRKKDTQPSSARYIHYTSKARDRLCHCWNPHSHERWYPVDDTELERHLHNYFQSSGKISIKLKKPHYVDRGKSLVCICRDDRHDHLKEVRNRVIQYLVTRFFETCPTAVMCSRAEWRLYHQRFGPPQINIISDLGTRNYGSSPWHLEREAHFFNTGRTANLLRSTSTGSMRDPGCKTRIYRREYLPSEAIVRCSHNCDSARLPRKSSESCPIRCRIVEPMYLSVDGLSGKHLAQRENGTILNYSNETCSRLECKAKHYQPNRPNFPRTPYGQSRPDPYESANTQDSVHTSATLPDLCSKYRGSSRPSNRAGWFHACCHGCAEPAFCDDCASSSPSTSITAMTSLTTRPNTSHHIPKRTPRVRFAPDPSTWRNNENDEPSYATTLHQPSNWKSPTVEATSEDETADCNYHN
ncbi:hypothetical protein BU24DRAFT_403463 [Aaosphaeria arxii CBS 175.79]|uniref:Uncharacterized protein n=1 Tax=Aaosphaeria arxii CBS 175.79 TaxID=1450172 RepID=A0A6A5Y553_9PLEO|nr:uncharacterized protein BU24DRAFT_403463 [Aaosphaeria arxii CBS 175.79]KAF2020343.1 hypothetical protein BU24DRAFT_403463 [Aaosphaeria arxii CBS 175.79]